MTPTEAIDQAKRMEARERDALIARSLFGWVYRPDTKDWERAYDDKYDYLGRVSFAYELSKQSGWFRPDPHGRWWEQPLPYYFTDPAAAVEVMDKLFETWGCWTLASRTDEGWHVRIVSGPRDVDQDATVAPAFAEAVSIAAAAMLLTEGGGE